MPAKGSLTPIELRFWNKVDKNGPIPEHAPELGPCWVWIGKISSPGYGAIWFRGGDKYAHRACWEILNGPIPEGAYVLHKCDNRRCVNDAHLFLGSHQDNIKDMLHKGRQKLKAGERHQNTRLKNSDVLKIREMRGTLSNVKIGRMFKISDGAVRHILARRTWKHI